MEGQDSVTQKKKVNGKAKGLQFIHITVKLLRSIWLMLLPLLLYEFIADDWHDAGMLIPGMLTCWLISGGGPDDRSFRLTIKLFVGPIELPLFKLLLE